MMSDLPIEMKDYLYNLFVDMAVSQLPEPDVKDFINLLNDDDEEAAKTLVIAKLPDFEEQYQQAIKNDFAELEKITKQHGQNI